MAAMVLGQRTDCEAKSEVVAGQPHMRLNAGRIQNDEMRWRWCEIRL